MKSRDSALRLKRFEVAEMARKANDLEAMIREFEQMVHDLSRQITAEEERTGVRDSQHFAYSTFAKSVALRRDNLATSIIDLRVKLERALADRAGALEDLAKIEATEPREVDRPRSKSERNGAAL